MSNLTNNTSELRDILAAVNALPEASGSGGITPSGTKTITENGEGIDVTTYAAVNVRVPSDEPNIQPLNVTENGTYTPSGSVDGYAPVTVNVPPVYLTSDAESAILMKTLAGEYVNNTATIIEGRVLQENRSLTAVKLPAVERVDGYAFQACTKLERADFSAPVRFIAYAFSRCEALSTVILRSEDSMCTIASKTFQATAIENGTGFIYVPSKWLSDTDETKDYRRANGASDYAAQFRAIEDYPNITGG